MAKLTSVVKFEGTIDDLTYYKSAKDGHLVRKKGGISAARLKSDPKFKRTRENMQEFGTIASKAKLIRNALQSMLIGNSDSRMNSRLWQLLTTLKQYDTSSPRGARTVEMGLTNPDALRHVIGFNFNSNAVLASIITSPFTVDVPTGTVSFKNFIPATGMKFPASATHVGIKVAVAHIDFSMNFTETQFVDPWIIPIDMTSNTIDLSPANYPQGNGLKIVVVALEFYQQFNGTSYPLNNGSYNAVSIVGAV